MVLCSMCPFVGDTALIVLKHVVDKHKNNPSFQVQCRFGGCGRTYQIWDSFTKHLRRKHRDEVPADALLEDEPVMEPPQEPPQVAPQELPLNDIADNDSEASNDEPATPQEVVSWKAGKFLTVLREEGNTSQRAVDLVTSEANDLKVSYLNKIQADLKAANADPQATSVSYADLDRIFAENKSANLFEGVSSKYLQDQFLTANGMVATEKISLGKVHVWSQTTPPRVVEKEAFAYVLPLEASLRQLLSHPEILQYVLNPVDNVDAGTFKDVKDGSYFKNHVIFSNDRHALIIMFYYDDLQTSNVVGSKPHKFGMFYWTLGNIPPHLRSSLRSVNLYGIVRTKYLRQCGPSQVLKAFNAEIVKLQTEGFAVLVRQRERIFRGSLLFVTGDTPASQLLGGFKEGVGQAHCPCRNCNATQETMQDKFLESDFTLRNKQTHNEQVEIVTDPTLPADLIKYHSKQFGVVGKSAFSPINHFDETKCLLQDFMHVVFEGTLPFEIQHFLRYLVREKGFSLKTLNHLIKSFNYTHLQRDRPSVIEDAHLDNKLRQNSLQVLALGHALPFLLKPHIESIPGALERLQNLVVLLQICNLALSYELREDDVALLEHLIRKHHTCFKMFYPDVRLPPKMHYMIHFPRQVLEFGPPRYHWCVRYEGEHWYFKRLMQIVLNYKNPPLTMCARFSSKRAVQLLTFPGHVRNNFLDMGDKVGTGSVVSVETHPHRRLLRNALPNLTDNHVVMNANFIVVRGTKYSKQSVILVQSNSDDHPVFGQVVSIVVQNEEKLLVCKRLETVNFDSDLNAYKVLDSGEVYQCLRVQELPFPHPLSKWRCERNDYIVLFNCAPSFAS